MVTSMKKEDLRPQSNKAYSPSAPGCQMDNARNILNVEKSTHVSYLQR